jgi:hypothetical protein
METFAHFEIFDQEGNRAAEGHKVRRPCLAVLNFFSIMFPKKRQQGAQARYFRPRSLHMRRIQIFVSSVCTVLAYCSYAFVQSVHKQSWRMLRTFDENLKICLLRYRGWDFVT